MLEALDGKPFARLVAMGPLALMPPIHAAWVEETGGNRRYVHDDVALSYLPSAAALLRARMRGTPATSAANRMPRPLIISAPADQEAGPLAWSEPGDRELAREAAVDGGVER